MAKNKSKITTVSVLGPRDIMDAVKHLALIKRAGFIWGPPGIGKSQVLRQVAESLGMQFVDIRLSQIEPTDIRGIPVPVDIMDEDGNLTGDRDVVWAPPSFFERDPSKPTFYLFDEMNAAPGSIQAAAYQIILDRKLGDFALGPEDVVMAAGNRDTDRGTTFKMPTPLMNRFVHLEMEANFSDWEEYALEQMFHPTVVGFIDFNKSKLFDFDPTTASRGFCTPRSWEIVSNIMKQDGDLSNKVLRTLVAGAVGEGAAAEYMTFRKNSQSLPNPSDILSGKVTTLNNTELHIQYVLVTGICFEFKDCMQKLKEKEITEDEYVKTFDTVIGFFMDNFTPEMVILGARVLLGTFKVNVPTRKSKNWLRFSEEYSKYAIPTE